jgi:thiamine-phosphate pyrophosphorylase
LFDCPLVAIGGITAQNGRPLIEAGADMLAVIRGVFAADDVSAAARSISQLFMEPENHA